MEHKRSTSRVCFEWAACLMTDCVSQWWFLRVPFPQPTLHNASRRVSHCWRFNELFTINLILSWLALGPEPRHQCTSLLEKAPRYHLYLATEREREREIKGLAMASLQESATAETSSASTSPSRTSLFNSAEITRGIT